MLEDLDLHASTAPNEHPEVLPGTFLPEYGTLKSLNLDSELYTTYAKAKNYLETVQYPQKDEPPVPANQIAQVMNTITSILREIVKMQTELHNAEQVKKYEQAVIFALKKAPESVQKDFFDELARLGGDNA